MTHQILDQCALITRYYLWYYAIWYIPPRWTLLANCYMNQYFTLVTKVNDNIVNDCNIFNHFLGYHMFILKCRFKQPSQQIGREHMSLPCMEKVCIIMIITRATKCSFFWCFVHMITRTSIWWIYDCSCSGINQCHAYRILTDTRWPSFWI